MECRNRIKLVLSVFVNLIVFDLNALDRCGHFTSIYHPGINQSIEILLDTNVLNTFSYDSKEKIAKYTPPNVTLDNKSLRIINMHGASGLPKGTMEVFIQHRFATFGYGAYNWYGFDQSYMRLGFDYGVSNVLTTGISRSSMNKVADAYMKWQFKGASTKRNLIKSVNKSTPSTEFSNEEAQKDAPNLTPWKMSLYSNISINTDHKAAISPEPFNYSNRLRFVNTLIVSKNFGNRFLIATTPSLVHINLVDKFTQANDILVVGGYARLKLSKAYAITAEYQKPLHLRMPSNYGGVSKYADVKNNQYLGLGFEIFTAKHMFQLSVSNAQSMNETYYLVANNGALLVKNLRFGFNIVRRW